MAKVKCLECGKEFETVTGRIICAVCEGKAMARTMAPADFEAYQNWRRSLGPKLKPFDLRK